MRFVLVFVLIAVAEMATFFWVGSWIGLGWALGLALVTAILGSYLVKRAGLSVLNRLQGRFREGEIPGRELSDGACVLIAGAFLISPGFLTDTMGFLLLLPPIQSLIHRIVSVRLARRFRIVTTTTAADTPRPSNTIDVDPVD